MQRAYCNVRDVMDRAARKSGRKPEDITLVAVSKNGTTEQIHELAALGQRDFAENRVQVLVNRMTQCDENLRWHCIGQLQSNKVKYIMKHELLIHSLDRLKLAGEMDLQAQKNGGQARALVQVKFDTEKGRGGVAPNEIRALLDGCAVLKHLSIEGLMCMAPLGADEHETRTCFASMQMLYNQLSKQRWPNVSMMTLSMGMSRDYHIAIEYGATMVRVGSALFEFGFDR